MLRRNLLTLGLALPLLAAPGMTLAQAAPPAKAATAAKFADALGLVYGCGVEWESLLSRSYGLVGYSAVSSYVS